MEEEEIRRPLGLTLLTGLYLFFFLLTVSTFGSPFPFLGRIYMGTAGKTLIFIDSLICLYLFLGLYKRQLLTWYLLIAYNLFEIGNTILNLNMITVAELEKILGTKVNQETLVINNVASALAVLLLTQYVYKHKHYFTNRDKYLF